MPSDYRVFKWADQLLICPGGSWKGDKVRAEGMSTDCTELLGAPSFCDFFWEDPSPLDLQAADILGELQTVGSSEEPLIFL